MKNGFVKIFAFLIVLVFICISTIGCGETFSGAGKDVRRMGKGVKTIFVRDSGE